jgi:hypothetical protein
VAAVNNGGQQTIEGKITGIEYLPGATPESAKVELQVQAGTQVHVVRLAPAGFLKKNGLTLREGMTVSVKGFAVAGMEGDLLVASEIRQGEKSVVVRDGRGVPVW